MHTITLSGHYDGKQILLDEPYPLEPNTRLMITVLPDQKKISEEWEEWYTLSLNGLAQAYTDEEIEYSLDMIKRKNPDYDQRG